MGRSKILYLLATLGLHVSLTAAALDRSRSQFKRFFPTVEEFAKPSFHRECPEEFANYFNEDLQDPGRGHKYSGELMNCILEEYGELSKANMAVTAILLALLPAGLVQFGPSMAEISILSTRRPILATFLGFGLMSPNPTEFDYEGILQKAGRGSAPLAPIRALDGRYFIAKVFVSLIEYSVAFAATANLFYQMFRFTYWSISLAPLVVYLPGVPETATLFGWAFLNLPIHLFGFVVFAMSFRHVTSKRGYETQRRNRFLQFFMDELTPCGQGRGLGIKPRRGMQTGSRLFGAFTRLVAGLHIITGTVLIGSIVLIPMADSLPIIYSFVGAAVATRAVLSYEIHGLAGKTDIEPMDSGRIDGDQGGYPYVQEAHAMKPKQYEGLRQRD